MSTELPTSSFAFEDRHEHGFEDEPVRSCYLSKVIYYRRSRNAWHGNWSAWVSGPFFDIDSAKRHIEPRRAQGSHWTINELPVVIVAGDSRCLILGEFNSQSPLSSFLPLRKRLSTLEEFGTHFRHPWPWNNTSTFWSMIRIVCKNGLLSPARLPFLRYQSYSLGGFYLLRWTSFLAKADLEGTLHLVSRINVNLQHGGERKKYAAAV